MENLVGKCYKYSYDFYYYVIDTDRIVFISPTIIELFSCKTVNFNDKIEIPLDEFKKVLNEKLEFFRTLEPKKEKYFTPEQVDKIMEVYSMSNYGNLRTFLEGLEK